jgi:hypothetical protein
VSRLLAAAGGRSYLLGSPDFWCLRDLEEVSKGAFSVLLTWMDAAAKKVDDLATATLMGANAASSSAKQ